MNKGQLIILSGPSGVGKSTIVQMIKEKHPKLYFSVSATTRKIRPGETDGVSYHFISREQFMEMVERGEFLEHAIFVENCYGTPAKPIDEALNLGYDVILDIEVQGAMQVMEKRPDAVSVYILPPSLAELRRRLTGRGDTAPEVVEKRLTQARIDFSYVPKYDYIVISENNKAAEAADEVLTIMSAARCRTLNRLHYLKEEE